MSFDIPVSDSDKPFFTKFPKKLFSYIKTQKTENSSIPSLRENGLLKSDTHTKSNILNQQFHKEFTPVTDTQIPDKGPNPHPQMKDINVKSVVLKSSLDISTLIKPKAQMKSMVESLKIESKNEIAPILTIIFQKSLFSGTIPSDWKHANVCPVYKKGDKHDPKNYRPIFLTCIRCKLCEHIIASSLMKHLEESNILYDLQHGFRSSRSCETQLISFIQDLAQSVN